MVQPKRSRAALARRVKRTDAVGIAAAYPRRNEGHSGGVIALTSRTSIVRALMDSNVK